MYLIDRLMATNLEDLMQKIRVCIDNGDHIVIAGPTEQESVAHICPFSYRKKHKNYSEKLYVTCPYLGDSTIMHNERLHYRCRRLLDYGK